MLTVSDFLIKTVYILLLERLNFVRIEKQKEKKVNDRKLLLEKKSELILFN